MTNDDRVVTKSEFAKLCGVVPGRVTQWIAEGKISASSLVGEGRAAKVRVGPAMAQVNLRRDVGQALGNGAATRLRPDPTPTFEPDDDGDDGGGGGESKTDDVDRKLKLNKLEAAERENRIAAAKEAAAQGFYTETSAAWTEMGKIAGQMVRTFEGAIPEIATAIAAEFRLDARDVTHLMNEQFRKVREQAAAAAAKAAEQMPERVEHS